jgi:hypothetical protein
MSMLPSAHSRRRRSARFMTALLVTGPLAVEAGCGSDRAHDRRDASPFRSSTPLLRRLPGGHRIPDTAVEQRLAEVGRLASGPSPFLPENVGAAIEAATTTEAEADVVQAA